MRHKTYLRRVGRAVRRTRCDLGLTLDEISDRSGISKGALSKIENGGNLTVHTLACIAESMQVGPGELLGWAVY